MADKPGARPIKSTDSALASRSKQSSKVPAKGKRRCVAAACIPCRKRKSKCDGGLPKCATCTAVYRTECSYDPNTVDTSQRPATQSGVKRSSSTTQEPSAVEYLIDRLLSLPESEAVEAVYQLRANGDIDAVAELLRKNVKISDASKDDLPTAEHEDVAVKGDLVIDQSFRYGITSGLGYVPTEDDHEVRKPIEEPPSTQLWTDITTDSDYVHHLIKLYFTWINHCCPLVSEKDFYEDFYTGRTQACSGILVNAMCAAGSLLTNDSRARKGGEDCDIAGEDFYQRVRHLLFKEQVAPKLTTVQGLQILSQREASLSRVSSGFRYAGWALNTAIELGMHLEGWKTTKKEDSMRRSSFWAMFNFDTSWSLCVGRVAMLPRAAIEIEKPNEKAEPSQWHLYDDQCRESMAELTRQNPEQDFLFHQSSLTELLSQMLVMFYAPQERLSSRKVLDLYARLQTWYKKLPFTLLLRKSSAPSVFQLHMWYWTCLIHLFRPIARMKLVGSEVQPRQVCIDSAMQISTIIDMYRSQYPMKTVNLLFCHMLLTAALTHLFELPHKDQAEQHYTKANIRALQDVTQCLRDFITVSFSNTFAFRAMQIIRGVADKYELRIEGAVLGEIDKHFERRKITTAHLPSKFEKWKNQPAPHCSRFGPPPQTTNEIANNDITIMRPQQQAYAAAGESQPSYPQHQPPPQLPSSSHQQQHNELQSAYPGSLFFTPIDGQMGVPIYNNNNSQSHMDLNVLLGAVNWPEQLRQDGFELSDVWGADPMAGTNAFSNGVQQQQQQPPPMHQFMGQRQTPYTDGEQANANFAWYRDGWP